MSLKSWLIKRLIGNKRHYFSDADRMLSLEKRRLKAMLDKAEFQNDLLELQLRKTELENQIKELQTPEGENFEEQMLKMFLMNSLQKKQPQPAQSPLSSAPETLDPVTIVNNMSEDLISQAKSMKDEEIHKIVSSYYPDVPEAQVQSVINEIRNR